MTGAVLCGAAAAAGGYLGLVTAAVPVDLGIGRRVRALKSLDITIAAPAEVVFDVISAPYAPRAPRAVRRKVQVLERGNDMVLAAHFTPMAGHLTATTVETVRFSRPRRVDFRLVRGPVPHVLESFHLEQAGGGTRLSYTGELGTDLWGPGRWWGSVVAARWQSAVEESFAAVRDEAERRARQR